jgi:hypothetical protein
MNAIHTYSAYGLTIAAELACPELIPASGSPDVKICYGHVPENLDNPQAAGVIYQAKDRQFLLKLDKIARYLVQNGNEIAIAPHPQATEDEVRLFLLGSCLGALLHQRGILAMHASAIQTQKGAVLFVGPSGNGKSTLLGALLNRGYAMLADDVAGIALDDRGQPVVLPAYPQLKLWHDACQQLEKSPEGLRAVRPELEKYAVPAIEWFVDRPMPLYAVYALAVHNFADLRLELLDNSHKFQIILGNTYRQRFLDGLGMRLPHFQLATQAAKVARVSRVTRPSYPFLLDELTDLIIKDWD